jgi:glycosyltransferase involved in cell wall biosynthesis
MDELFITVFSPNYNGSKFLPEAIESILNQTFTNFEYIIIDDASTDNSWEIIQKYSKEDKRIKPYKNEVNLHVVKTRNLGFKYRSPKSKYFAILDSDDVADLTRLEKQIMFLENNPDHGLVGSNEIIINEDSEVIGQRIFPLTDKDIRKIITKYNPFIQSSILLRNEVIDELKTYDLNWKVCQDYNFWIRAGQNWKLANLEDKLARYRLSSSQIKNTNLKETIKNTYKIQEEAIKKYGYKDSFANWIYRLLLKISSIIPGFTYMIYRFFIIKKQNKKK